jgi:hypothetical protein
MSTGRRLSLMLLSFAFVLVFITPNSHSTATPQPYVLQMKVTAVSRATAALTDKEIYGFTSTGFANASWESDNAFLVTVDKATSRIKVVDENAKVPDTLKAALAGDFPSFQPFQPPGTAPGGTSSGGKANAFGYVEGRWNGVRDENRSYGCNYEMDGYKIPSAGVMWGLSDTESDTVNVMTYVTQTVPVYPGADKEKPHVRCSEDGSGGLRDDAEIGYKTFMMAIEGGWQLFKIPVKDLIRSLDGPPVVIKHTGTSVGECGGCAMSMEPTGKAILQIQLKANLQRR